MPRGQPSWLQAAWEGPYGGRWLQRGSADRSARWLRYRPHRQAWSCWRGPRWEIARSEAGEPVRNPREAGGGVLRPG